MLNVTTTRWLQLWLSNLNSKYHFNHCYLFLSARSPAYVKISCLLLTSH